MIANVSGTRAASFAGRRARMLSLEFAAGFGTPARTRIEGGSKSKDEGNYPHWDIIGPHRVF